MNFGKTDTTCLPNPSFQQGYREEVIGDIKCSRTLQMNKRRVQNITNKESECDDIWKKGKKAAQEATKH